MTFAVAARAGDDWGNHMGGGGWWWVMGIGWLIFLAAIVILAVVLARPSRAMGGARSGGRDILDERFARGEIDEDEYRRRRDALSG